MTSNNTYIHTYYLLADSLTPWNRDLFEKLAGF